MQLRRDGQAEGHYQVRCGNTSSACLRCAKTLLHIRLGIASLGAEDLTSRSSSQAKRSFHSFGTSA